MGKFIYAIAQDGDLPYIETVIARDHNDAKEKVYLKYFNKYEDLQASDYDELVEELCEYEIWLGEIQDIETF